MIRIVKRHLSLLEYESYKILQLHGLNVPKHITLSKNDNIEKALLSFQGNQPLYKRERDN